MGRRRNTSIGAAIATALALSLLVAAPLSAEGPVVVQRTWPEDWPVDPAPITGARWPELPAPLPAAEPATPAAARAVELVERVLATQQDARYGWHGTRTAGSTRTPVVFGRLQR